MRWSVHATMHVRKSEDSMQELLLSFHQVCSWNWTQGRQVWQQALIHGEPSCWPKAEPFCFLSSLLRGFWFLHILITASCFVQLLSVLCAQRPWRAWNFPSLCFAMCLFEHPCDRMPCQVHCPALGEGPCKLLFAHFLTELPSLCACV